MAKVTVDLITQLREKTGIGMMDCKKALIETDGNLEKAIVLLRKKGEKVAAKRSDVETANGVVHAYIHPGSRLGVLVELNCETDFSANTESFKNFAQDLCMQIAAANPLYINKESVDPNMVEKEREILREQLLKAGKPADLVGKIVENKLEKFYAEVCLLNQSFIKNDKLTIQQLLNELVGKIGENIKIKRFSRFQLGS